MKNKRIILYFILGGLILFIFAILLVMLGLHYECNVPYSWKSFGISALILIGVNVFTAIMAFFGFYLPRFGRPIIRKIYRVK